VDVKSTLWVALMPKKADAELPNRGFDEWYDSSAARCRRCGWEGKARDVLIEKVRPAYLDRQNTASPPSFRVLLATPKGCRKVMKCMFGFRSTQRPVTRITLFH
jgi:hypothetical protein